MRIMVADQDSEHRQGMVEAVQKWGHKTQEALSARDIVEQCRKKCPDLIFIDVTLSGESGIEIIRQVRQTGGHAVWVPIVLMGKGLTDPAIIQSVEAGADDALDKPLSQARIMTKVFSAERMLGLKEEVFKVAHELVLQNRTLQTVVTQDMLTGISNSNMFDEALEKEWNKAKSQNIPLSLIFLNLDFFQAYNQAYGAQAGDNAIKQVAEALKLAMPKGENYLARTTGETFAVLLPNLGREQALAVAKELHQAIDNLNIPHKDSGCGDHLTASFGIATVDPNKFTKAWDLKDAADFGLYQAKHTGRNRCFLVND